MGARLLVIGLDAAEATLIEHWAGEGHLPAFAALMREGSAFKLGNPMETLPGAIWPELVSGRSCGRVPLYYHPRQLHTGEGKPRPVEAGEVEGEDYFWAQAGRAGLRVAAIDMPQTVPVHGIDGIQLFEWGLHDRNFAIASEPGALLEEVRRAHGDHPVRACDTHGECEAGYGLLLDNLLRGVRRKSALLLELLKRERWDLFAATFGETHCVGHQFWHFGDPRHPWYRNDAPARFRAAIGAVYRAVDEGIGALLAAAGPEARVLVVASHGMGLYTGGPQLLPEVLTRLGLSSAPDRWLWRRFRELQRATGGVRRQARDSLRALGGTRLVKRAQTAAGSLREPLLHPRTRAAALLNNRCGAIRFNLKGREPHGTVAPGAERRALLAELRRELLALADPKSGEPIVAKLLSAEEAFGVANHPDVPDLMVTFRDDLGPIERAVSPRLGRMRVPIYLPVIPRSGDHTTQSRLWARGPGIPAGRWREAGNVLDLAPTALDLLGVPLPRWLDGRPLSFA